VDRVDVQWPWTICDAGIASVTRAKFSIILFFIIGSIISAYKITSESSDDIILNGNVEVQNANISFRIAGRVSDVLVTEGQNVRQGEVLARIDDDILSSQYELAKSKLSETMVNLEMNKKDFDRNKELFKRKSIAEKVFDDSRMKYMVAKAQNSAALASFKIAEIQLSDSVLKSPIEGIVLTSNVEVGECVPAGMPAFSIMPKSNTKIKSFVNEETLSKIKYGGRVRVSIDSVPDKEFTGKISFISSKAEFTPKNIETKELRTSLMYRIRIILDNNAEELKQGMPVTMIYEG
jgi:HlyD family secretion protein